MCLLCYVYIVLPLLSQRVCSFAITRAPAGLLIMLAYVRSLQTAMLQRCAVCSLRC